MRFHLIEKIGPLCFVSVRSSLPAAPDQMRACPSYAPVARLAPSGLQSSVVTSFTFSLSAPTCCSTDGAAIALVCALPHAPLGTAQIRAVESPDPDASWSDVGLHAQMNTSPSWPARVVTCSSGVSSPPPPSVSIATGSELDTPPTLLATALLGSRRLQQRERLRRRVVGAVRGDHRSSSACMVRYG